MLCEVRRAAGACGAHTRRALLSSSASTSAVDAQVLPGPAGAAHVARELERGAHNYAPLPVVLTRGSGAVVFDTQDRAYIDCLAGYSAVNQGHCHPRIVDALVQQAKTLGLTSRAFYNDKLGLFEEKLTNMFGFDKALLMNTGVEAGETAVKLARKWGHEVKGVADGSQRVIFARGNFWGRTLGAISSSTDPESFGGYGPLMPGYAIVDYNDAGEALEKELRKPETVAFMVEPIQGEAGVVVPDKGYLSEVKRLCREHNVLLIADEVQTGLGRTGARICCDHEAIRPDILVLGKALSGGTYPVSAALADDAVMMRVRPGQHGSTYGGNPTAAAVGMAALDVLEDEGLAERAHALGKIFRQGLREIMAESGGRVRDVRGKGLLNAVEVDPSVCGRSAWDACLELAERGGVLAKPTHDTVIRLSPPLVVSETQLNQVLEALRPVLTAL